MTTQMTTLNLQIPVSVSQDKMTALADFPAVAGVSSDELVDCIRGELDRRGVCFGFRHANTKAAARAAANGEARQGVVVAAGLPPELPEVQCQYNVQFAVLALQGGVRATLLDQAETRVSTRTRLAEISVEGEALPGLDLYKQRVDPPDDITNGLRPGMGVTFDRASRTFVSLAAGIPDVVDDELIVRPLYRVDQGLHPWMGSIDFKGHVFVAEDVHPEAVIRAEGSVLVAGDVTQGIIEAGGNVVIGGNLVGAGERTGDVGSAPDSSGSFDIQAGGTVRASTIENVAVRARADVTAETVIRHSRVEAGHRMIVVSDHGRIMGGLSAANGLIEAWDIGSSQGQPTTVAVPSLMHVLASEEIRRLEQAIQKVATTVDAVLGRIDSVDSLPAVHQRAIQRCLDHRDRLEAVKEAKIFEREAAFKATSIYDLEAAAIRARGTLHKGVTVLIGRQTMTVDETYHTVVLSTGPDGIQMQDIAAETSDDTTGAGHADRAV